MRARRRYPTNDEPEVIRATFGQSGYILAQLNAIAIALLDLSPAALKSIDCLTLRDAMRGIRDCVEGDIIRKVPALKFELQNADADSRRLRDIRAQIAWGEELALRRATRGRAPGAILR
jgi:hypothetical protein